MSCDPSCADCENTLGATDASELYRREAARQHWAQIEPALHLPGADVSVALAFTDHGADAMHRAIRETMRGEVASMKHVHFIRAWAASEHANTAADGALHLAALGPLAGLKADATEAKLRVIGAGVAMTMDSISGEGGVLALTQAAVEDAEHERRHRAAQTIGALHPMLSTPGVRQRAGVHGTVRHRFPHADGHPRRQQDSAELAAPELPGAPEGTTRSPRRAGAAGAGSGPRSCLRKRCPAAGDNYRFSHGGIYCFSQVLAREV